VQALAERRAREQEERAKKAEKTVDALQGEVEALNDHQKRDKRVHEAQVAVRQREVDTTELLRAKENSILEARKRLEKERREWAEDVALAKAIDTLPTRLLLDPMHRERS